MDRARVRRVASHLDRELFMLTYEDGIGAVDLGALVRQHLALDRLGTVTAVHPASCYGEMHDDGDVIGESNVSGGFFAFNRLMVDKYRDGELGVYRHEGSWTGADTFRDWTELNSLWDSGNSPWKVWTN